MSYQPIRERLDGGGIVILDGGVGTEILRRNVTWADHQLTSKPEFVRGIHEDYIRAGAEIISTNSFQLSRRAHYNHFRDEAHRHHIGADDIDERASKLLAASVKLVIEAREQVKATQPVAVAAAITSLEWCFRPDLAPSTAQAVDEYSEMFKVVKDAGADLILLETVNSIEETKVALEAAKKLDLPCWVSFVPDEKGTLLNQDTLPDAVAALEPLGMDAILLNCAPPEDISRGLEKVMPGTKVPVGAYPHVGRFNPPEWMFTDEYPPDKYREEAAKWKKSGARILGGCCGTTPDHIAAIADLR